MKKQAYWLLGLSVAGLLFSGYLSLVKLFTNTCALGESCPYFLGYPACWYGFAMYLILTIASIVAVSFQTKVRTATGIMMVVSFVGILFAGSFVVEEAAGWLNTGVWINYSLGLPSCAYGLIFYILIAVISFSLWRKSR